jgi:hypothetical protein
MSKDEKGSFDHFVRKALGNHQVPYDESTWDLLEQKMTDAVVSGDDLSVDEAARQALAGYEAPYNPASWKVLSDRLDRINYRRRLIASKIFEAAVIFFAIFTMVKFLGHIPQVQEYLPKTMAQLKPSEHPEGLSEASRKVLTSPGALESTIETPAISGLTEQASTPAMPPVRTKTFINQNQPLSPLASRVLVAKPNEEPTRRTSGDIVSIAARNFQIPTTQPEVNLPRPTPTIPPLPVYDPAMLQAETATNFHLATAAVRPSKIKTSIGMFYQYHTHLVNNFVSWSPVPKQKIESSSGQGIVTIVQFGRFGFDLGASYSNVKYRAGTGENEIQKLQVPLNLRYTGLKTRYADFYAKAGVSTHAVLRAHYEDAALYASPGPQKKAPYFNDGLLEDGYQDYNTYYSLNAGIGVNMPIYKSFSLFTEVSYQDHWKGKLGYTADKFTTFSYQFGASYNFD